MKSYGDDGVGAALNEEESATSGSRGGSDDSKRRISSSSALQSFLDHIPISAISGLHTSVPVVEVKFDDSVEHAIRLLYENNVCGAPIADPAANTSSRKSMDRDIGFIELSSMVLWSIEEINKVKEESEGSSLGLLDLIANNSLIGQTKIAELAKSFMWEPFFPAHEDNTLFHLLLLFTKHHRLNVIPVIGSSNSSIIGFITQHAVIELLLQSRGLEWFDEIADKYLSEFGLINASGVVYSDQSLADALHILWDKQLHQVPIVDPISGMLTGCVTRSDIYLLLEDDSLFNKRKVLTVEEFTKFRDAERDQSCNQSTEKEYSSAGLLRLTRTSNLVTLKKTDSLKKAMENMVASMSESSFFVGDSGKLEGTVTLRDVLLPFSPPSMDSRINGGSFFTSLLNQAGCHVDDGEMIQDL
ncbi:hypothetical protein Cni_G07965 [Canna indica]|uniref:CBS domain-containing protein n=1 Tax=Canna indica TaxID=4628 RepID=A0AAQ3K1A2_9LILI|nr:hypothetical protein Cni_G07965 [Canna indica]